jgi:hypothetical protein
MTFYTELQNQGLIQVQGPDAKTFLQGQLTCDLNTVTAQQSQLGAHCNLKGRMISLFRVMQWGPEHYMLSLPLTMVSSALQNLKKYAIFSKVTIDDQSQQFIKIGIAGDQAPSTIATVNADYVLQYPDSSLPRFEIYTTSALTPSFSKKDPLWWAQLDIQAGIPTVYPETIEMFLPHHVNLFALGGIGLEKGCYLGQEIIARMHYKGNIKKKLMYAMIMSSSAPQPGNNIFIEGVSSTESPGTIVRAAPSENNAGFECLLVIDNQYADLKNAHLLTPDGPVLTP